MNFYIFQPHPEWVGAVGVVGVTARDFQRAEKIALEEAGKRKVPGHSFSILKAAVNSQQEAIGHWTEIERYRDVEDDERLVFFSYAPLSPDQDAADPENLSRISSTTAI